MTDAPPTPIVPSVVVACLARRLGPVTAGKGWAAPPLPDLIARIDEAVAARRARGAVPAG